VTGLACIALAYELGDRVYRYLSRYFSGVMLPNTIRHYYQKGWNGMNQTMLESTYPVPILVFFTFQSRVGMCGNLEMSFIDWDHLSVYPETEGHAANMDHIAILNSAAFRRDRCVIQPGAGFAAQIG
jgi:hypothetical protein